MRVVAGLMGANECAALRAAVRSRLASGELDRNRVIDLLLADEAGDPAIDGIAAR